MVAHLHLYKLLIPNTFEGKLDKNRRCYPYFVSDRTTCPYIIRKNSRNPLNKLKTDVTLHSEK